LEDGDLSLTVALVLAGNMDEAASKRAEVLLDQKGLADAPATIECQHLGLGRGGQGGKSAAFQISPYHIDLII
jgi:hypothetical protein